MQKFTEHVTKTPQTEQADPRQTKNEAGGYTFTVDKWTMLDRFLILGTEGGTYYCDERKQTRKAARSVDACLKEDGVRLVRRVVEISRDGRAHKNDAALWVHAYASVKGDLETKEYAFNTLNEIARIGTHLFHWVEYRNSLGGWGNGAKRAVARWYTQKDFKRLAYQLVKYKQRDGWSHRDVLRVAHPKTDLRVLKWLFDWVMGRADMTQVPDEAEVIVAAEGITPTMPASEVASAVRNYWLTREMLPTEQLKNTPVWRALLEKMPLHALVRNLGVMTANGTLKALDGAMVGVNAKLTDADYIKRSRLHPMSVLAASLTYASGHGARGKLSWTPIHPIIDALESTFTKSFANVEPTGKAYLLGIDVSASMTWQNLAGVPGLTPQVASAAMALVTAKTEQRYQTMAFSAHFSNVGITASDTLASARSKVDNLPHGGTDCSLPMLYAIKHGLEVDVFVVYTDNETWCGAMHPHEALAQYRKATGKNSKCVIVAMTATESTFKHPDDSGMLEVVGFDTQTPQLIAEFAKS